ncbi:hypothetical protein J2T13_000861 [Paenibacillus sp. DS2015]|uniref:hypothetical protein n=1 Tax=Paenibacillus sp. DS2015 TaxID=3373917 RepID=UPI003D1E737C
MDNIYTTEDDTRKNMLEWSMKNGYMPAPQVSTTWEEKRNESAKVIGEYIKELCARCR